MNSPKTDEPSCTKCGNTIDLAFPENGQRVRYWTNGFDELCEECFYAPHGGIGNVNTR